MKLAIQLYTFNDYVGYMVMKHKEGFEWSTGLSLTPVSYYKWEEKGRGTLILEDDDAKTLVHVGILTIRDQKLENKIVPYVEKEHDYVGTHEFKRNLKAEMLTPEERRAIKQEAYDALVKPQHRMNDDVRDKYRITKKEYTTIDKDEISQPTHYTTGGIEPIKFIQSHSMNFEKGNVIKYVTRAGKKEGQKEVKDLKKARQYLDFLIKKLEDDEK